MIGLSQKICWGHLIKVDAITDEIGVEKVCLMRNL